MKNSFTPQVVVLKQLSGRSFPQHHPAMYMSNEMDYYLSNKAFPAPAGLYSHLSLFYARRTGIGAWSLNLLCQSFQMNHFCMHSF